MRPGVHKSKVLCTLISDQGSRSEQHRNLALERGKQLDV